MPLTPDHIIWAYRLLLDRDPEDIFAVANKIAGCPTVKDLREVLLSSAEYRDKNPEYGRGQDDPVAIKILEDGTRIFLNLSDQAIGVPLLKGEYETGELRFARRCVRPGDVSSMQERTSVRLPSRWQPRSDRPVTSTPSSPFQ